MISWLSFQLFSLAVLIALWSTKLTPRVRTYQRAMQIRRLLNPHCPLEDLLLARARPNQRLVHAFGITSTFVSGDTKVHKAFTTSAKALIAATGNRGRTCRMLVLSAEATYRFLPTQNDATDFSSLIQCITFSVVLSTLFHTDLDALRYDDVVHATDIINQRWEDSKVKDEATMRQDDGSLRTLLAHVERWVDSDQYPNPLNFILPAYETLWRVVAVTVAYAYRCRDNVLQDAMIGFAKDPTEERFMAFGEDGRQPSMQAILLEVLRLHPPTRHIVRAKSAGGSWWWRMLGVPAIEVADVESVHRTDDYGENPLGFDPMRFHPSRMRQQPELYSFGYGKLKCVAAAWAPMAAAVIAATIVAHMEETDYMVTMGPNIGGRSGWEGWKVGRKGE